jgi:hypothetical protein
MIKIKPVPINDIIKVFGQPGEQRDFVKRVFPFPLRLSYDKTAVAYNFYGHKYIADAVIEAFEDIRDYYGLSFIKGYNLDLYGGCFADRMTVSGKRKSVHAWGLAIDYLPDMGAYNKPSTIPYHIVKAFTDRGFVWGGDWQSKDGMHFSAIEE